ncbi:hypothetical protein Acsp03_66590 [Actinomadura sp. NBRC 104412]|nr:hypothetical protein Acsp03_66590 [Actinomadura sp. NBRC 104412]
MGRGVAVSESAPEATIPELRTALADSERFIPPADGGRVRLSGLAALPGGPRVCAGPKPD